MSTQLQHTIKKEVTLKGKGLFMGEKVNMRFKPAGADHGIVFVRTDVGEPGQGVRIPALVHNVTRRARRTVLQSGDVCIETCEHCMSALAGMGIDNIEIEVEGPELVAGDGSAKPFTDILKKAGIEEQDAPRRIFKVTEPITITEGNAMIAALPYEGNAMQVIYDLDYPDHPVLGHQVHTFASEEGEYLKQIADARTFVLEEEAQALQAQGLGQHLTPNDVLVINEKGPMGKNKFRYDNEPVRHKIVDVIGDLYLLGSPIHGRIVAYQSGHAMNHKLAMKMRESMINQQRTAALTGDGFIDIRKIQRILPHRYPMLMVDRVLEIDGDQKAVGVKNVTINEPFFGGHYPGTPIMPGVLIVEALAQLSGVLLSQKLEHTGKIAVLLSMDKVKLRKPVTPGDQLVLEAHTVRVRSRTGHTQCYAYVGDQLAAEAEIKFMLVDSEED